jgi:hypothetical protein
MVDSLAASLPPSSRALLLVVPFVAAKTMTVQRSRSMNMHCEPSYRRDQNLDEPCRSLLLLAMLRAAWVEV